MPLTARVANEAALHVEALSREVERLRLLASRERGLVEAILRHSPHGIIVADADGKLILQNQAAERIWAGSASADTVADWGAYRAFHRDGRPYAPEDWSMARALRYGQTIHAEEVTFQRFDGSSGTLVGSSTPLFDANGKLDGALSIFTDISEIKEQQRQAELDSERYLTTLRSIGEGVIATDPEGRVTFLNPVAEQLTGAAADQALGRPITSVYRTIDELTRTPRSSNVARILRHGTLGEPGEHTLLVGHAGREYAIEQSGAKICDTAGSVVGAVIVFRDITERRKEERRRSFMLQASTLLASSLDFSETLSRVAQLAVPTLAEWCVIDLVEAGGTLRRVAMAHAIPEKTELLRELSEKYPPDPSTAGGVFEVIRTGNTAFRATISDEELLGFAKDARHLRLMVEAGSRSSMIVALRCKGRTLGAISFVRTRAGSPLEPGDVTFAEGLASVAALAIDNARLFDEARASSRAKDEFMATVSHELRTPLNAILGWASLLASGNMDDGKRARAVSTIVRNARVQAKLIEDLLDVSRIASGKISVETRRIDLRDIVSAASDSVRLAADAKQISVAPSLPATECATLGDPARLQQIVWNLLSNAVKFTPSGGEVSLTLAAADGWAELRVQDTGVGIEPQLLPHVFQPFRQADSSSTRTHGGLGLGLAIVRNLVHLHGGTVHAFSAGLGLGSTFVVRLPLTQPSSTDTPRQVAAGAALPSVGGLRVLVVDDEPDARALIAEILEARGARVWVAASTAEALFVLDRHTIDVLLSDINMPLEDGYALIRLVRASQRPADRPLPAAALTALARPEDRAHALLAGFQAHLPKPIEAEELLLVVASLAGRPSN